ncbi:MAG TPA: CBS domain-containing protein [Methanocella sp.]|nr:CBS domain-containing protein [Methanocella sp.]
MIVEDVMTKSVITCTPSDKIEDIVRLMSEKKISGIPVVDKDKLVGIVTEEDIMKILAVPKSSDILWLPTPFEVLLEIPFKDLLQLRELQRSFTNLGGKPVKDIMSKHVWTTTPEADVEEAASDMVRHRVNRLPVMKGGQIMGIVTRDDIIHGLGGNK